MEGLAGFGLGVFGTFNGLYVLKETIEDIIISFGQEEGSFEGSGSHHHHHHYTEADPERYPLHPCPLSPYIPVPLLPHYPLKSLALRIPYPNYRRMQLTPYVESVQEASTFQS